MSDNIFSYEDLKKIVDVSRETFFRLEKYVGLLRKWQEKINLISNNTVQDIWVRHVSDSAQIANHLTKTDRIMDVGSGAGFPGMVLSILGIKNMTLVESDSRKVAFLREAARVTETDVNILCKRIEETEWHDIDVITARAFASVKEILELIGKNVDKSTKLLLLKGKAVDEEVGEAKINWRFDYKKLPSVTDPSGSLLFIEHINRRAGE